MAEDTEYELLPHEELERLRNEVSEIKKNPLGKRYGSSDLIDSMHKLTDTLNNMNQIFASTNEELLKDFKDHSLQKSFETMSSQNEELAKGILSVAQLVQKQSTVLDALLNKFDIKHEIKNELEHQEDEIGKLDLPKPGPKTEMPKVPSTNSSLNKPQEGLPGVPSLDTPNPTVLPLNSLEQEIPSMSGLNAPAKNHPLDSIGDIELPPLGTSKK